MLEWNQNNIDIEGLYVGDFGCGAGMLSIASGLLECCVGFDVDASKINIALLFSKKNDNYFYLSLKK